MTADARGLERSAPTLLERDHELEALRRALTEAQRGRGQLVLIEATAGLGKTSLLKTAFPGSRRSRLHVPARAPASSSATSPTAACGS